MYHYFNACEISSFETLTERFLMEQFASSLPENVRAFVHAKQPQNAEQMALFGDLSYEVSNIGKESGGPLQNNAQRTGRIEVGRYPGTYETHGPQGKRTWHQVMLTGKMPQLQCRKLNGQIAATKLRPTRQPNFGYDRRGQPSGNGSFFAKRGVTENNGMHDFRKS